MTLQRLLLEYAFVQILALAIWFLIYRQLWRLKSALAIIILIIHSGVYIWLNYLNISELLIQPDLRIGGITFAFEMLMLINAGIFTGILLFAWLIFYQLFGVKH